MANTLKIKRGLAASIPQGQLAEPLFTTDTYDLYIGKGSGGNQRIQKYVTSGTSAQFLKGDGSLDSNIYEPSITAGTTLQYWRGDKSWQTLNTGVVPESGPIYFTEPRVLATVLTGLNLTGGGTISASDSVLQAFGKIQNQISAMAGGVSYQGTWDASTNTPTLTSSVGTKGYYYVVSVAGSTNLNGITDWRIGDWAIFNGTTWDKVDNTDAVSSVNGFTGAVNLGLGNISDVTLSSPTNTQLLRFNGTTSRWENWTPTYISGAITSLNGLTASTQTFATGTSGTDFAISSSTSTHTFNLPDASATARGVITTGTQTIAGSKTFSSSPTVPSLYLSNMTAGSGALYYGTGENRLTLANYNVNGIIMFEVNGGNYAMAINADSSIRMHGYTTNGFVKFTGSNGTLAVDTNTYALDSAVVKLSGDQTINGQKSFTGLLIIEGSGSNSSSVNFKINATSTVSGNGYSSISATTGRYSFFTGTGVSTSKTFAFDYTSITDNTTRVYTMPNATGTLALTSDLSAYLPLTGGTLTGALNGTSATFGNTSDNTNAIQFLDAASSKTHIGSGFGATFIQNNNYFNGTSYVFDDNTKPSANISLSAGTINFQTGAANANPSTKFTMANTGAATFSSSVTATNVILSATGYLGFGGGTNYIEGDNANNIIRIGTNNTAKVTINGSGNVGIGTTSPTTTLEARGTGNTAINSPGNLMVSSGGTATQAAEAGGQLSFGAWLGGDLSKPYPLAAIRGVSESATTNNNRGALIFGTMDSNTAVQERMRITSGGNISINVASPTNFGSGYNVVSNNGTASGIYESRVNNAQGGNWGSDAIQTFMYEPRNLPITFGTLNVERMRISSATDNRYNITMGNDTSVIYSANNRVNLTLGITGTNSALLGFKINGTSKGYLFHDNGTFQIVSDASTNIAMFPQNAVLAGVDNAYTMGANGSRWSAVWAANGTIQTSDARQKKDITPTNLGLDFIMQLNPVSYKWIVGGNKVEISEAENENEIVKRTLIPVEGKRTHYGLIAQQVKEVLGDIDFGGYVHDEETDTMALRYDQFIAPIIKAIQELKSEIDILKNKN